MKLLPCPFCGTHRTKLVRWPITPENFGAEIRCECGCHGPAGFGKSYIPMAADLWNRREHSADRIKRLEEVATDQRNRAEKWYIEERENGDSVSIATTRAYFLAYTEIVREIRKAKEAKP